MSSAVTSKSSTLLAACNRVNIVKLVVPFIAIGCVYLIMTSAYTSELTGKVRSIATDSRYLKFFSVNRTSSNDILTKSGRPSVLLTKLNNLVKSTSLRPMKSTIVPVTTRPTTVTPVTNPMPIPVEFILHPGDVCTSNPKLRWLVYVHSGVTNYDRRQLLRSTWASKEIFRDSIIQVVFVTGRTSDKAAQKHLYEEQLEYNDIVQGDFIDHYHNLTLKAITSLKWVSTFCKNAKHVLKVDDDIFMNIFEVMDIVEASPEKRLVVCPIWQDHTMGILRDPKTCMKWCVKDTDFPGQTTYPQYCAGWAYSIAQEVIPELYQQATNTPFFWIDDVFITGVVLGKLKGIHFIDLLPRMKGGDDFAKAYKNFDTVVKNRPIIGHLHNANDFKNSWKNLLQSVRKSTTKYELRKATVNTSKS